MNWLIKRKIEKEKRERNAERKTKRTGERTTAKEKSFDLCYLKS